MAEQHVVQFIRDLVDDFAIDAIRDDCLKVVDSIPALTAENERLREIVGHIADHWQGYDDQGYPECRWCFEHVTEHMVHKPDCLMLRARAELGGSDAR